MARLTKDREMQILKAYDEWDPRKCTMVELAHSLDTSKQTIYTVLDRHGVERKTLQRRTRQAGDQVAADLPEEIARMLQDPDLHDRMARVALGALIDEVVETRRRIDAITTVLQMQADSNPLAAQLLALIQSK